MGKETLFQWALYAAGKWPAFFLSTKMTVDGWHRQARGVYGVWLAFSMRTQELALHTSQRLCLGKRHFKGWEGKAWI